MDRKDSADSNASSTPSSISTPLSLPSTAATTPDLSGPSPSLSLPATTSASAAASAITATATFSTATDTPPLLAVAAARAQTAIDPLNPSHPPCPMTRVYNPTKDAGLTVAELLARPRLPRSPAEKLFRQRGCEVVVTAADDGMEKARKAEMFKQDIERLKSAAEDLKGLGIRISSGRK